MVASSLHVNVPANGADEVGGSPRPPGPPGFRGRLPRRLQPPRTLQSSITGVNASGADWTTRCDASQVAFDRLATIVESLDAYDTRLRRLRLGLRLPVPAFCPFLLCLADAVQVCGGCRVERSLPARSLRAQRTRVQLDDRAVAGYCEPACTNAPAWPLKLRIAVCNSLLRGFVFVVIVRRLSSRTGVRRSPPARARTSSVRSDRPSPGVCAEPDDRDASAGSTTRNGSGTSGARSRPFESWAEVESDRRRARPALRADPCRRCRHRPAARGAVRAPPRRR